MQRSTLVSLVLQKIKLDLFILLQMKLKNVVTTKQEKLLLEKVTWFGEGNASSVKIGSSGVYSECTSYDYGILLFRKQPLKNVSRKIPAYRPLWKVKRRRYETFTSINIISRDADEVEVYIYIKLFTYSNKLLREFLRKDEEGNANNAPKSMDSESKATPCSSLFWLASSSPSLA